MTKQELEAENKRLKNEIEQLKTKFGDIDRYNLFIWNANLDNKLEPHSVCIGLPDPFGLSLYTNPEEPEKIIGFTLTKDTKTIAAGGTLPAELMMREIEYTRRYG